MQPINSAIDQRKPIAIPWLLDPREDELDVETHGCGCGCGSDCGCGCACSCGCYCGGCACSSCACSSEADAGNSDEIDPGPSFMDYVESTSEAIQEP